MKRKTKVYQIDQSGKIEQTSLNTIIALSNDIRYSIVLPKKAKRLLQEIFRNQQRPRMFIYDTFAALITLVFIKTKPVGKVVIDKEYRNQDLVKARILEFFKIHKIHYNADIEFGLVRKSSPAHILAARVANKKVLPNLILTLEDISAFLWPIKKTGYSAINRTEGNLTQDWLPGGRKPSQSSIFKKYHKRTKKSIKKIVTVHDLTKACHPESFDCAQGKLREGSKSNEILRLCLRMTIGGLRMTVEGVRMTGTA